MLRNLLRGRLAKTLEQLGNGCIQCRINNSRLANVAIAVGPAVLCNKPELLHYTLIFFQS